MSAKRFDELEDEAEEADVLLGHLADAARRRMRRTMFEPSPERRPDAAHSRRRPYRPLRELEAVCEVRDNVQRERKRLAAGLQPENAEAAGHAEGSDVDVLPEAPSAQEPQAVNLHIDLGAALEVAVERAVQRQLDADPARDLLHELVDERLDELRRRRDLQLDEVYTADQAEKQPKMTVDERKRFLQGLAAKARLAKRDVSPEARQRMEREARRLGLLGPNQGGNDDK